MLLRINITKLTQRYSGFLNLGVEKGIVIMCKFILSGFSDEISNDFDIQLKKIKEMKISYIEIRVCNGRNIVEHSINEVKELKAKLDEMGIGVSAIGSPIGKIKIDDDFKPHFELFKHTVDIAKVLNTKFIRIFSFYIEHGHIDENRDEVMSRLDRFKDYVDGTDIILLHENENRIYGDTPDRCFDIVKTMNSENFKLIFDPANFVQCGVVTYPDAYNMIKDHVIYFHIKDAIMESGEVVPSGAGDGHIREIIKELADKNYQGFLSLEPHLDNFSGFLKIKEGDVEGKAAKFRLAKDSLCSIVKAVRNGEEFLCSK